MALQTTDLFIVERGGVQYKMTADQIRQFLGTNFIVADIAARDALTLVSGDEVYVVDATADSTVDAGGAKYIYDGTDFIKVAEDESFDVTISPANLGYTASPTGGTITNTNGTGASLPVVNATNAGLATPAMFQNNHVAATTGGSATSNPINISGQEFTFGINQLTSLP